MVPVAPSHPVVNAGSRIASPAGRQGNAAVLWAGLGCLLVSSCAERGPAAELPAICDGARALKLRVYQYSNPHNNLRGSTVRIEEGSPSFALDGECNYYMNGGWLNVALGWDFGWRTGLLPDDGAEELRRGLDPSRLEQLKDCEPATGLFDVDPWVISSAESSAACVVPGPRFAKALALIAARAPALWSSGQPMTGAMRFSAASAADDHSTLYPWALAVPLGDFVIPENVPLNEYQGFSPGVSHLVSDPSESAKLRELRERYLAERAAAPARFTDGQLMSDGTTMAFVYMRDALPYEDQRGLWPF